MKFVNTADLIVVGGGLAGLYTTLHAAEGGARVALLVAGRLDTSNSMWAQGGIAAALGADDTPTLHLEDTLTAGRGLCSYAAAAALVEEGPGCIHHLVALGVPFDLDPDGGLSLALEGGHGRRRIVHAGGVATGAIVTRHLTRIVRAHPNVQLFEGTEALALQGDAQGCTGVLARSGNTLCEWAAPATVLATGGAAGLYARTTNPAVTRGDGIALAFRAGAAVADMEFVQFHPTALVGPRGETFLLSEAIRGEGAHLRNAHGDRFMLRHHPLAELAPRDTVARAIWGEMRTTGTSHVWLDLSPIPEATIRHHFASLDERCRALGLDMAREPLPVAPAAHYAMGGVRTDLDGATNVPGLWAVGEVACTGVQGANRLASNSLLECLVFGRRVAQATRTARCRTGNEKGQGANVKWQESNGSGALLSDPSRLGALQSEIGRLLWQHAGLVREGAGLRLLLAALQTFPAGINATLVARLIVEGALRREESRGGHFRTDFPDERQAWEERIVFQQGRPPRRSLLEHESTLIPENAGSATAFFMSHASRFTHQVAEPL